MSEVPLTAQTFHNVSSLHFFSHIIPPFTLGKSQKKNRNKWVFFSSFKLLGEPNTLFSGSNYS